MEKRLPALTNHRPRSYRHWRMAAVLWAMSYAAIGGSVLAQSTGNIDSPVAYVGHGAAFAADGEELLVTPEMVAGVQSVLVERLMAESPNRADYEGALQEWRSTNPSFADEVHANAEMIGKLLDELQPRNFAHLTTTNSVLLRRFVEQAAQSAPSPGLTDMLRTRGLARDTAQLSTTASGQDYIDLCSNQGVPIPPSWGDPAWNFSGSLATKFILASREADVWTYESASPRGICIALPRYWAGANDSFAFGIICQGNDSSKSCYWDADQVPLTGATVPLLSWKGGADLFGGNGVCTDCHAGENAFIVHPNTALDVSNLRANAWIDPIVDTRWVKNPGPSTLLDGVPQIYPFTGSCVGCHSAGGGKRFPAVSTDLPGYCSIILKQAYAGNGTMPPANPGAFTHFLHAQVLQSACQGPPPPDPPPHANPVACKVFDDGYNNSAGPSEAIFFSGDSRACIPDTGLGTCRKWFGQCASTLDGTPVYFEVFNDGVTARTVPTDAIYNRMSESECVPDNTSTGTCRKWFGIGRTADDRAVECYLFDDGLTNWVGPTTAIYYRGPNQVCMPDGTDFGTCRKWFGNCQVTNQPAPPRVVQPPQPPEPSEERRRCLAECAADRDDCMANVGEPGEPPPSFCVSQLRACRQGCPTP